MRRYKNYLLSVLLVIMAFNYVDRGALGLVLQNIKIDLLLTDTQLGVLTGLAFALFYSVLGIPIARWADRGNRVTIITLTTALWSAAVALLGIAVSFPQLLLIRVGVAIGEAGCLPAAHSLIPDYFTRAERPRAVALYMLGLPLSLVVGYFVAGWLNELYGWRMMFVLIGLPGLGLAALARFTLREPRLKGALFSVQSERAVQAASLSLKDVCLALWAIHTFRHLALSLSVISFFSYGIFQWLPTFFIRSYGMTTGELGGWLAGSFGLGGVIGTYLGGMAAARYAAKNERLQLKVMAALYVGFGVLSVVIYLTSNRSIAFALMGLYAVGVNLTNGPFFATIQTLVPNRMRAMAVAIMFLLANLIGMGLGPLAAGAVSDALRPWAGEESLRYALMALCPGYLWGAWHMFQASRSVTRDVDTSWPEMNNGPVSKS
jgi:MFS family permease